LIGTLRTGPTWAIHCRLRDLFENDRYFAKVSGYPAILIYEPRSDRRDWLLYLPL